MANECEGGVATHDVRRAVRTRVAATGFTALVAVGATGVAAFAIHGGEVPAPTALVVLAALAAWCEHQRVRLPNGIALSAAFMIGMTAIVVFHADAPHVGPMIVGACSALGRPRRDAGAEPWHHVTLRAANLALAYAAAATAYGAFPNSVLHHLPSGVLAALPAALAVVGAESLVLWASSRIEHRHPLRALLAVGPSFVHVLPFAIVGLLLGRLYLDIGWPVALLLVAPILLARDVFHSFVELHAATEATVGVLVRALEAKDAYTAGHVERVARYAELIGTELDFMPGRLERLRLAALLHDIGKLVVPNELLHKPGRLTADEYERIRLHEGVTIAMLQQIDFLRPIAPTAGSDPNCARRDVVAPIEPAIIAVADAYDAMTSTRSYRRALDQQVAFTELRACVGTQFDHRCVEALISVLERRAEVHGAGHERVASYWRVAPPVVGVGSAGLGDLLDRAPGAASAAATA